jgi:hypothetical protein
MNSGSYFSNLMATGFSYSVGYGAEQRDDEPDDTPPHDEAPVQRMLLLLQRIRKGKQKFQY